MRAAVVLVTALVALGVAAPAANASDYCRGAASMVAVGPVYVVVDAILTHYHWARVVVYLESNGRPDLQRGGVDLIGDPDICQDDPDPDTLVTFTF